jgi:hypothetical protein
MCGMLHAREVEEQYGQLWDHIASVIAKHYNREQMPYDMEALRGITLKFGRLLGWQEDNNG